MKNLQNRFLLIVFVSWLITLVTLLIKGSYMEYLRPEFFYVLLMGSIILFLFLLCSLSNKSNLKLSFENIFRGSIILLPILFFHKVEGTLGASAFKKRFLSSTNINQNKKQKRAKKSEILIKGEKLTIIHLYNAQDRYVGKKVAFIGMVYKAPKTKQQFGHEGIVVFRFVINCCAADAIPVAALVEGKYPKLKNNTWVKVEGVLQSIKKGEKSIPFIQKAKITKTKKPRIPFLYY